MKKPGGTIPIDDRSSRILGVLGVLGGSMIVGMIRSKLCQPRKKIRNRENEPTALRIKSIVGLDSRPIVPEPTSKSTKRSQSRTRTRLRPEQSTTNKTTRRHPDHPPRPMHCLASFRIAESKLAWPFTDKSKNRAPVADLIQNLERNCVENRAGHRLVRMLPDRPSKPANPVFSRDSHGKQGTQCVQDLTPMVFDRTETHSRSPIRTRAQVDRKKWGA